MFVVGGIFDHLQVEANPESSDSKLGHGPSSDPAWQPTAWQGAVPLECSGQECPHRLQRRWAGLLVLLMRPVLRGLVVDGDLAGAESPSPGEAFAAMCRDA